ncbi:MAG: hypothetical protein JOZ88_03220 [Hyphomicrobiales bacterium]|nr:hypothetical protein [Hyphomicrobiales bacterium]
MIATVSAEAGGGAGFAGLPALLASVGTRATSSKASSYARLFDAPVAVRIASAEGIGNA